MTAVRLWSFRAKMCAGLLVLLLGIGAALWSADLSSVAWPTALAAAVAIASLLSTAISAYSTFARARRKDTLDAWSAWSDSHRDSRRRITVFLGKETIAEQQANALADVDGAILRDKHGTPVSRERCQEIAHEIADILNGLERLATGVVMGIYDEAVLRRIGATIIVRTYERFEPYIDAKRRMGSKKKQQSNAYIQLETLVAILEIPRLDATRKGKKQDVDRARLRALSREG